MINQPTCPSLYPRMEQSLGRPFPMKNCFDELQRVKMYIPTATSTHRLEPVAVDLRRSPSGWTPSHRGFVPCSNAARLRNSLIVPVGSAIPSLSCRQTAVIGMILPRTRPCRDEAQAKRRSIILHRHTYVNYTDKVISLLRGWNQSDQVWNKKFTKLSRMTMWRPHSDCPSSSIRFGSRSTLCAGRSTKRHLTRSQFTGSLRNPQQAIPPSARKKI